MKTVILSFFVEVKGYLAVTGSKLCSFATCVIALNTCNMLIAYLNDKMLSFNGEAAYPNIGLLSFDQNYWLIWNRCVRSRVQTLTLGFAFGFAEMKIDIIIAVKMFL